ncbi:MAG: ABC transporter permease [Alphaproteobacteria bacterium]|nr:MAG: ABC transporter permease [Alphaproteobacteria bacterium]
MVKYLLRRTLGAIVVMWAVATLVFFMLRIVPGDPMLAMVFDTGDPAAAEQLRRDFGLDKPLYVQYGKFFVQAVQGNLGTSLYGSRVPVTRIVAEAFPRTISLALLSFLIAIAIAVPAGLISALKKHSALDHGVTVIAFLGLSMPDFWLAILLIIVFAAQLHWLPAIGYVPLAQGFWPWFSHLILPSIAVGTPFAAIMARMIRSSMLEVLRADFMRVAASKGLLRRQLIFIHALPNALIPIVTVMGIAVALLMAGTVVVENVFAIKGLGRVLIQSILNRDYPVVQGAILVVSAIFVFSNLLVDMLYTVIDPRIRYE